MHLSYRPTSPLLLIATCSLGLEEILAEEIRGLRLAPSVETSRGGVTSSGDWAAVVRANVCLRTANRVVLELARFKAVDGDALANAGRFLAKGPLKDWLRPERSLSIVATAAPPLMLSRESTSNDLTWRQALYVTPAVIAEGFWVKQGLPVPIGVFANQPNPWSETHQKECKTFWKLALLAIVLQVVFSMLAGGKLLLRESIEFLPSRADETWTSREFTVTGKASKLAVRNVTSLANNWIGLDMTLVNKATGAAWPASREISYYYGIDGGESWSEGSRG